jgi:hypothetical protein
MFKVIIINLFCLLIYWLMTLIIFKMTTHLSKTKKNFIRITWFIICLILFSTQLFYQVTQIVLIFVLCWFVINAVLAFIFMHKLGHGKTLFEFGEYDKAKDYFLSALKYAKRHPECLFYLEKTYSKLGLFDKASKAHIEFVNSIGVEKLNPQISDKILLNKHLLRKLLLEKNINIEKIDIVKRNDNGLSGSLVYIAEIFYKNSHQANFAVIKIETSDSIKYEKEHLYTKITDSDLERESQGYNLFKQNWSELKKIDIPSTTVLVSDPELVSGRTDVNILFSSFADERNTKNILTLKEGLENDFEQHIGCIRDIWGLYQSKYQSLEISNAIFGTPMDHILAIFDQRKDKFFNFKWGDFGLNMEFPNIVINGNIVPNLLYHLNNDNDTWGDKFNAYYYPIHGDLNLDNIIVKSNKDLVLIDFEKTKEQFFFFDIGFLTMWCLQIFLLNKIEYNDTKWSILLEYIRIIVSFIKHSEQKIHRIKELGPIRKILNKIYPFKETVHQNTEKEIMLSLIASATIRSYYELRDYKKDISQNQHHRDGLFYYALACELIDNSDLLNKSIKLKNENSYNLPNINN